MNAVSPVQEVEQEAAGVVRHQPRAHALWQFNYRNSRFRHAIANFDKRLYALSIEKLTDDDLTLVDETIGVVIKILEVHASRLGDGVRDVIDREYFKPIIRRLEVARDGIRQGLSPDPARRPTREQLLDRMAGMLKEAPLSLPDHTRCEPAGRP